MMKKLLFETPKARLQTRKSLAIRYIFQAPANLVINQITTHLYPLHRLYAVLPYAAALPLRLPFELAASPSPPHDGGYCWRLQR